MLPAKIFHYIVQWPYSRVHISSNEETAEISDISYESYGDFHWEKQKYSLFFEKKTLNQKPMHYGWFL